MRLKSIRLVNFRSFRDSIVVFPDNGLVLIRGKDLDTGESSGTGKSAIFLGLAYVFDILPPSFSAKALQNWDTDDGMMVTVTVEHEGKEWYISRGKKTLIRSEDYEVIGAKSYPAALEKLFGFGSEVLSALVYRPQGQSGFFLGMPPAAKIEFMTRILGLDKIETAVDTATTELKRLESLRTQQISQLTQAQSLLNQLTSEEIPPDVDATSTISSLKIITEAITNANTDAIALTEQIRKAFEAGSQLNSSEINDKTLELATVKNFIDQLRQEQTIKEREAEAKTDVLYGERQRVSVRFQQIDAKENTELKYRKNELKSLLEGVCPECKQSWVSNERIAEIKTEIENTERELTTRPALLARQLEIDDEIKLCKVVPDPRIQSLREVQQKLLVQLAELKAQTAVTPEITELKRQQTDKLQTIHDLKLTQAKYEGDLREKLAINSSNQKSRQRKESNISGIQKDVDRIGAMLETTVGTLNAEKDFTALMGREGFLGVIFEEVLEEIVVEVNKRLRLLANVNQVTLSFTTETEKGKRQLQAWVDVRGHRAKFETGLSGGMQTSLEQITDLAVMDVISRRSGGKVPGWLCLDEVFNGQGAATKEAALEVLQQFGQNRLVLVIDHDVDVKEAFSKTIDIEFKDGVSTVATKE
jgi:hypothetical protein